MHTSANQWKPSRQRANQHPPIEEMSETSAVAYMVGGRTVYSEEQIRQCIKRFIWITYRYDMCPIGGTLITSDAGWGCMIRSGQMLTATAISHCLLGPKWIDEEMGLDGRRHIIHFFLDTPSHPLSIHNIAKEGERHGRRIGDWHAPSNTSHSISSLLNGLPQLALRSACILDMTVNLPVLRSMLDGSKLLLWIPMRWGIDYLNELYTEALKRLLMCRFCVGVAGGRPNSSLYFVGFQGDDLMYLDPHISRPSVKAFTINQLRDEDIRSYSCPDLLRIRIQSIDPSFVAGFVIADLTELEEWTEYMQQLNSITEVISFTHSHPTDQSTFSTACREDDDVISIDFD